MEKPLPLEVFLLYEIQSSYLAWLLYLLPYNWVRKNLANYFVWKTRRKYRKHYQSFYWAKDYENKQFVEAVLKHMQPTPNQVQ